MSSTGVQITAGLGGFLVLFGLALTVWFLGRDLTRRLRRMRQREALRLREAAAPHTDADPRDARTAEPGEHAAADPRDREDGGHA